MALALFLTSRKLVRSFVNMYHAACYLMYSVTALICFVMISSYHSAVKALMVYWLKLQNSP